MNEWINEYTFIAHHIVTPEDNTKSYNDLFQANNKIISVFITYFL